MLIKTWEALSRHQLEWGSSKSLGPRSDSDGTHSSDARVNKAIQDRQSTDPRTATLVQSHSPNFIFHHQNPCRPSALTPPNPPRRPTEIRGRSLAGSDLTCRLEVGGAAGNNLWVRGCSRRSDRCLSRPTSKHALDATPRRQQTTNSVTHWGRGGHAEHR